MNQTVQSFNFYQSSIQFDILVNKNLISLIQDKINVSAQTLYPCLVVTQPFFLDCIASKTNFTYTYTLHFFIPAEAEKGCYDSWNDSRHFYATKMTEIIQIQNQFELPITLNTFLLVKLCKIGIKFDKFIGTIFQVVERLSNFHLSED